MKRYALLTSLLGGSDHIRALAAYLQENGPRYPRIGGWLAPRAGLDALLKETSVHPPSHSYVNQPVVKHTHVRPSSLYLRKCLPGKAESCPNTRHERIQRMWRYTVTHS